MFSKALANEKFAALRGAYAQACVELGLGPDEIGRDRLAQLMVTLAEGGEQDPDIVRAHAVHRMRPPAAGSFYRG